MNTTDRLAEIAARAEAATPGTWGVHYDGETYHLAADIRLTAEGSTCSQFIGELPDGDNKQQAYHDATFIRCARADIPWLLAELAKSKAVISELTAINRAIEQGLGIPDEPELPDVAGAEVAA